MTTRRNFLKTSAAVSGATLLGALDPRRFAHAAEGGPIKLGLIGCGGRGTGAASDALTGDSDTKLWAVADVFADKTDLAVKTLAPKFKDRVEVPQERQFAGLNGYRGVIENCDVVLIACASRFHADYALAAVKARKHVFAEKPGAVDVAGVLKLLEADELCKKNGTGFLAGVTYRYHLGRREAVQRMQAGEIGDIVAIQCEYLRSPYRLIERKPEWSEMEYQFRNWYHFNWLSGDDVPQSLLHSMDKGCWALREQTPETAFATAGRSSCFGPVYGDVFDHGAIVYEYANGVRMYANVRAQAGCYDEVSDTFLGTKGRCYLLKYRIEGETNWRYDKKVKTSMYDAEHQALFAAIRSGKPINNGRYMAHSTLAAIMGRMAAYTGQEITWEMAMNSKQQLVPDKLDWNAPLPVAPMARPGETKFF
ncbi:MAG: Gfo/Idh/MocA family oxidoreductase [Verrucomicrobiae bacterium]|nr:Gfo/Idh/MocA family oxidoreductase [Verrucomicrobiae bacterium]